MCDTVGMPSLVITNAATVRLVWTKLNLPFMVNVLGAINSGPATFGQTLANSLGLAIKNAFTSSGLASCISTDVALASVYVRSIASANQPEFQDANAAVVGSAAADPLPAQTAFVVTLRTALAGPAFRGRIYLGGFAEDQNDTDGNCVATAAQDAVDFVTAIKGAMTANGLTMAVLSRPREETVIPARTISSKAGFATAVSAEVFRDRIWDTQRRRQHAGI